jgi:outer membrane protein W
MYIYVARLRATNTKGDRVIMKCVKSVSILILTVMAGLLNSSGASTPSKDNDSFVNNLEIGTRFTYVMLKDSKRDINATSASEGSFYGSITEMKAVQNTLPLNLYADYRMAPDWGFELALDRIQSDTITRSDGHNDGTVDMIGPMVSIFGRLQTDTIWQPYGGAGFAYMFTDFAETYQWYHALDPVTGQPRDGEAFTQTFDFDNSIGIIAYGGVSASLNKNWSADLFVRYMQVEAKGVHYNFNGGYEIEATSFKLPMSNETIGLGVRYIF